MLPSPPSFCNISSPSPSFLLLLFFFSFPFISFSLPIFFLPLFFRQIHFLACLFAFPFRPLLLSFSCFHTHTLSLFPSIGFNHAKFVRTHWLRPLGNKEMTEGVLYLPLRPLPCRLLNHVANRQHCLPTRLHSDNGVPHSYLIQWSV